MFVLNNNKDVGNREKERERERERERKRKRYNTLF
jgi:hypothetical protein